MNTEKNPGTTRPSAINQEFVQQAFPRFLVQPVNMTDVTVLYASRTPTLAFLIKADDDLLQKIQASTEAGVSWNTYISLNSGLMVAFNLQFTALMSSAIVPCLLDTARSDFKVFLEAMRNGNSCYIFVMNEFCDLKVIGRVDWRLEKGIALKILEIKTKLGTTRR